MKGEITSQRFLFLSESIVCLNNRCNVKLAAFQSHLNLTHHVGLNRVLCLGSYKRKGISLQQKEPETF